jgi:outer membrane protein TolC
VSKIQEEISQLTLQDLQKNVSAQAENFLSLYDLRNSVVQISVKNSDYAQRAYNLAEERFNFGSLNSIDLMSMRNNYIQSQVAHLENLYNRIDTFYELYRLGGMLTLNYASEN